MRRARLPLLLALACGCVEDPPDDEGDPGDNVCAGDLATLMQGDLIDWLPFGHDFGGFCSAGFDIAEDHANWVADAWGEPPREFLFGLFESRDHPCWICADMFDACTEGRSVAATKAPHRHEIAHAVRGGPCYPLIEEGWAMLYGDHFEGAPTTGDIRVAVEESNPGVAGVHYPIATRFVAFLLETRGVSKLRDLCAARGDAESFEAAVLDTYGVTFDDLANEFDTYPEWTLSQLRQDQACDSNDVIVGPTSWDFAFECGAPGIEGKLGAMFETQRLIELPEEGIYQLIFESPIELKLQVELRGCAREGMASSFFEFQYVDVQAGDPKIYLLLDPYPAGVYVVRVRVVEPTQPVNLHMSIQPWP